METCQHEKKHLRLRNLLFRYLCSTNRVIEDFVTKGNNENRRAITLLIVEIFNLISSQVNLIAI